MDFLFRVTEVRWELRLQDLQCPKPIISQDELLFFFIQHYLQTTCFITSACALQAKADDAELIPNLHLTPLVLALDKSKNENPGALESGKPHQQVPVSSFSMQFKVERLLF